MKVVEVENLKLTYDGVRRVLDDVSFEISKGEFVVILGKLGSGKTSLLRVLSGLIPHIYHGKVEGKVSVCGKNIVEIGAEGLVGCVGLVIDDPSKQIFNLTVEDDVAFGPLNMGLSEEEVLERTRAAIEALGLVGLEKRNPKELSGGQQQRVALAGVFALRPKLLLLDEPISMLDPIGKMEVLRSLRKLNRDYGVSCIISESGNDLEEIVEIASRIIVLDKGKIIADGGPEDVLSKNIIEKLDFEEPFRIKLFSRIRKMSMNLEDIVKNTSISDDLSLSETTMYGKKEVLNVENVEYAYPNGVLALKDISLNVYEGEMLGIIGQNGSGKTTLALVMAGVLVPQKGKVHVFGRSITEYSLKERIRLVNYVFQNPDNQLFSETVEEEVAFALKMLKYPPNIISQKVTEALRVFGLEKYRKKPISELTKDIKALTSIASVYVLEPKILIVDEPTNGLDFPSTLRIMRILKELTLKGKSVIVISHNMKLIHRFCDRLVVIHNGQVFQQGIPNEVFKNVSVLKKISIKPPPIFEIAYELSEKLKIDSEKAMAVLKTIIRETEE